MGIKTFIFTFAETKPLVKVNPTFLLPNFVALAMGKS